MHQPKLANYNSKPNVTCFNLILFLKKFATSVDERARDLLASQTSKLADRSSSRISLLPRTLIGNQQIYFSNEYIGEAKINGRRFLPSTKICRRRIEDIKNKNLTLICERSERIESLNFLNTNKIGGLIA